MTRRTPAEYDWTKCEFDEQILPAKPVRFTSPREGKILFIGIHHMTIVGDGTGKAIQGCINTWKTREASAHYGVEEDLVGQFVWDRDAAYALADRTGNHNSINIEHANSKAGPSWEISAKTLATSARLVANLHVLYKLGRPVEHKTIRWHQEFYATSCPGPFFTSKTVWSAYVANVQRIYDELTGVKPVDPPVVTPPVVVPPKTDASWSAPSSFKLGATGPDVLRLGQRLQVWAKALGLPAPYKVGPGSPFTETDQAAVKAFQEAQGWTGTDADGFPGAQSLAILASDPPTTVTVTTAVQNMAGNNATGIKTAKARTAKYIAARKATPVDVIAVQETTVASLVRPLLDTGLKPLGYKRAGGGEGRYVYTGSRLKILGAGMVTAPKSLEYQDDNKQAGWVAYSVDGAIGVDMSFHAESDAGAKADQLRPEQVLYFAAQLLSICDKFKAPRVNGMLAGDTNSEAAVLAAMLAAGWRNVAAGTEFENTYTFMGWDGKSRKRYDYGFVLADAPPAELVAVSHDTDIADHAGLRIVRQLTK